MGKKHPPLQYVLSYFDKDPSAPQRTRSAYMWFCDVKRPQLKQQHPGISSQQMASQLGQLWKQESEEGKKQYYQQNQRDKQRYAREMAAWNAPERRAALAKHSAPAVQTDEASPGPSPQKTKSSYMWFCDVKRPQLKQQHPGMNIAQMAPLLGQLWKQESEEGKQPYYQLGQQEKERYAREVAAYWGEPYKAPAKQHDVVAGPSTSGVHSAPALTPGTARQQAQPPVLQEQDCSLAMAPRPPSAAAAAAVTAVASASATAGTGTAMQQTAQLRQAGASTAAGYMPGRSITELLADMAAQDAVHAAASDQQLATSVKVKVAGGAAMAASCASDTLSTDMRHT